jgi:hypothetical protein
METKNNGNRILLSKKITATLLMLIVTTVSNASNGFNSFINIESVGREPGNGFYFIATLLGILCVVFYTYWRVNDKDKTVNYRQAKRSELKRKIKRNLSRQNNTPNHQIWV